MVRYHLRRFGETPKAWCPNKPAMQMEARTILSRCLWPGTLSLHNLVCLARALRLLCSANPSVRLLTPADVTPRSRAKGLTSGSVGQRRVVRALAALAEVATKHVLSIDKLAPRSCRAVRRPRNSRRLVLATASGDLSTASRLRSSTQTSKFVVSDLEVMDAAIG